MSDSTPPNPLDTLQLRHAEPSDWNRIRSDWKLSYRDSPWARTLLWATSEVYYGWQSRIVDALLVHPECEAWVACWAEDPNTIAGWAVNEGPRVLHYVCVKHEFRRLGIAKRLLAHIEQDNVIYTHRMAAFPVERRGPVVPIPYPASWTYDPRPALRKAP